MAPSDLPNAFFSLVDRAHVLMRSTADDSYYLYTPNKIAPIWLLLEFAVLTGTNTWESRRHKTFCYTIYHPICCFLFTIAFALREYGAFHHTNDFILEASDALIGIAIPILGLANYHVLARLFRYIPNAAVIRPHRLLLALSTVTGIIEVLKIATLARIGCDNPRNNTSPSAILGTTALVIQEVSVYLFLILILIFHYRCWKAGIGSSTKTLWRPMVILYFSFAFVLLPTEFQLLAQLIEVDPFRKSEWWFYLCIALPMLLNEAMWNIWHPGFYLPSDGGAMVGAEEEERQGLLGQDGGGYGTA